MKQPALALGPLSALSGGSQYHELRGEGYSPYEALPATVGYAGAEMIGEKLPLDEMMKAGVGSLWKRVGKTALADAFGEGITQAIQSGIDTQTINPDLTMEEFLRDMAVATGSGFVSGGLMGAPSHFISEGRQPAAETATPEMSDADVGLSPSDSSGMSLNDAIAADQGTAPAEAAPL